MCTHTDLHIEESERSLVVLFAVPFTVKEKNTAKNTEIEYK